MINSIGFLILCLTVAMQGFLQFKINLTANRWMKRQGEEIVLIYEHLKSNLATIIRLNKQTLDRELEIHSRIAALENELIALKRKVRGEA